jgi:glyoxylase-like metal-dependent hydrolase (beta-lactamase superfamily II)
MDCCAHEGPASGDARFDVESDDDVVIVDTHSKPSAARVIVDRLREITAKPVRYVVNTHFHWDHWHGNEVYPAAYPGAEIITNQLTREAMVRKGLKRIQDHVRQVPGEVARLRAELAARRPSRPTSTTARGGPACSPTSSGLTRW